MVDSSYWNTLLGCFVLFAFLEAWCILMDRASFQLDEIGTRGLKGDNQCGLFQTWCFQRWPRALSKASYIMWGVQCKMQMRNPCRKIIKNFKMTKAEHSTKWGNGALCDCTETFRDIRIALDSGATFGCILTTQEPCWVVFLKGKIF